MNLPYVQKGVENWHCFYMQDRPTTQQSSRQGVGLPRIAKLSGCGQLSNRSSDHRCLTKVYGVGGDAWMLGAKLFEGNREKSM